MGPANQLGRLPSRTTECPERITMSSTRRIGIFTGNRAEYGLLFPILDAVRKDPDLELALFVGGAHLSDDFGRSLAEVEADGFEVAASVPIELSEDTLAATAEAIGRGVISVSRALAEIQPDIFVVYADRFEGFAALIASSQMGIPTVHVEGGDLTEGGALDDTVRHAMTKLAHIHMTTNQEAARRVRALGEEEWRIFNVGFPTIDLIKAGDFDQPEAVAEKLGLDLDRPVLVFTQHSITTEADQALQQLEPSLDALGRAVGELGAQCVLTYPNNDAGGARIAARLEEWAGNGRIDVVLRRSLGRRLYHGVLSVCGRVTRGACIGNSSSGLKETPAFGCPTVNIGSRQAGRLAGGNVINVGYDAEEIFAAIRRSTADDAYRKAVSEAPNPYGAGDTGPRVAGILGALDLKDPRILRKRTILEI
ncbi:MAG: UDP-N-acetylglucosamine 2-epimerase (hydrolyzing) [Rhodobacteraceae bacterium]|nr:UDP-N-acetylglucosamine 2-epimerase (hydrolyzing) [Paracoccaceae bacterium]